MPVVEKNDHGIHMAKSKDEVHAVYRIVEVEAKVDTFEEAAEHLELSLELVEEAMEFHYNNPIKTHEDALTAQYWFFKDEMENILQAKAKISQDCPECEVGTLTPEHLYPIVYGHGFDYRGRSFRMVSCDRCDYDYDLRDSFKGFDEGFQLKQQGQEHLYTIETRLVDWDDGTIWYLLRDHSTSQVNHVTHQQLTEEYEVYTGG